MLANNSKIIHFIDEESSFGKFFYDEYYYFIPVMLDYLIQKKDCVN